METGARATLWVLARSLLNVRRLAVEFARKIRRIDSDVHAARTLEGQEKGNVLSRGFRRERKSSNLLRKAGPAGLEPATSWFVAVNPFVDPAQLTSQKGRTTARYLDPILDPKQRIVEFSAERLDHVSCS